MIAPYDAIQGNEPRQPRILIVDDCPNSCRLFVEVLGLEGFNAYSVSNPLRAYDAAVEVRPDLIILDYMMPYLTGEDLFRIFRIMPAVVATPVIFMSASGAKVRELLDLFRSQGASGMLVKPFSLDDLCSRVAEALGSAR
ncbi:MAG TPA: response regulator [Ktedonobacterales bacterium]|nr:response regulator [Ktedonobacterales bacterium]